MEDKDLRNFFLWISFIVIVFFAAISVPILTDIFKSPEQICASKNEKSMTDFCKNLLYPKGKIYE